MLEFVVRKRRRLDRASSDESWSEWSESSDGDRADSARIRAVKVLNLCISSVYAFVQRIVNVLSRLPLISFSLFRVQREKLEALTSQEFNADDARACSARNSAEKVLCQCVHFYLIWGRYMLFVCAVVHLRYALISCFFRICLCPFIIKCSARILRHRLLSSMTMVRSTILFEIRTRSCSRRSSMMPSIQFILTRRVQSLALAKGQGCS